MSPSFVIPAKAGTQRKKNWVPAFPGMTMLLGSLLLTAGCSKAVPSPPHAAPPLGLKLTGRVVDAANILSAPVEAELTKGLAELERTTTDQLVVVTVPNLQDKSIEDVGLELGRGWKIGRADIDNGVLLVVAPNERKVRIEVGYGLEALLTDARAGAIIREMLPKFRSNDPAGGIRVGVSEIEQLLKSDRKRPRYLNEARRRMAA